MGRVEGLNAAWAVGALGAAGLLTYVWYDERQQEPTDTPTEQPSDADISSHKRRGWTVAEVIGKDNEGIRYLVQANEFELPSGEIIVPRTNGYRAATQSNLGLPRPIGAPNDSYGGNYDTLTQAVDRAEAELARANQGYTAYVDLENGDAYGMDVATSDDGQNPFSTEVRTVADMADRAMERVESTIRTGGLQSEPETIIED